MDALVGVSELDGRVIAATGEQATIGGNGKSLDVIGLPDRPEQVPAFYVPLLDGTVPTACGQCASIRAKDEGGHCAGMGLPGPVQDLPLLLPHQLPAAQYRPLPLIATALTASMASVKVVSRKVASEREESCISTLCRDAPRMASCDRSRLCRCPRCSRSSASR